MNELPVISCDGCGLCCAEIVYPPFFGPSDPSYRALEADRPDLAEQLTEDRERRRREESPDWGTPCSWFDVATRKCRNYEHRPDICRDYEVGCESCLSYRKAAGL